MAMAAAGMPEVQVKFRRGHLFPDIPHACLIFAAADVSPLIMIITALQNRAAESDLSSLSFVRSRKFLCSSSTLDASSAHGVAGRM